MFRRQNFSMLVWKLFFPFNVNLNKISFSLMVSENIKNNELWTEDQIYHKGLHKKFKIIIVFFNLISIFFLLKRKKRELEYKNILWLRQKAFRDCIFYDLETKSAPKYSLYTKSKIKLKLIILFILSRIPVLSINLFFFN